MGRGDGRREGRGGVERGERGEERKRRDGGMDKRGKYEDH